MLGLATFWPKPRNMSSGLQGSLCLKETDDRGSVVEENMQCPLLTYIHAQAHTFTEEDIQCPLLAYIHAQAHTLTNTVIETRAQRGSGVTSTCCCRGPKFNSQHSLQGAHNCLSLQLQGIQPPLLASMGSFSYIYTNISNE